MIRYCSTCGKKMELYKEPVGKHYYGGSFSSVTGKKVLVNVYKCPSKFLGLRIHPTIRG